MIRVRHKLFLADPNAHLLGIEATFSSDAPFPSPVVLFMPVWTPGSYLVREHARHVEDFAAAANGQALQVEKVRKNAWKVSAEGHHEIVVTYRLYANELTVRTNHVDSTHAFWNGAATYLAMEGAESLGATVVVDVPSDWGVATALPPESVSSDRDPLARAARAYAAHDFDELCDSPFECGRAVERSFVLFGRTHRMVAWDTPDARRIAWDSLCDDVRKVVETEARLVAGEDSPEDVLPYSDYLFIWHLSGRGRGGLEHARSCTLLTRGQAFATRAGYLDVLSLVAHEFFHLWNVKRVRPAGLFPYRYEQENYTRALWWFEGATSYYDWRVLRLAGLASEAEYLEHLAEQIGRLLDTPGASRVTLEQASFDAWIKAYRPDENSANSTVSYYLKGEVVCALFDLEIRARTGGRRSLDDVVRFMIRRFGDGRRPIEEQAIPDVFAEAVGVRLDDCFEQFVRSPAPLPVERLLETVGLALERKTAVDGPKVTLGARVRNDGGRAIVETVLRGHAAHRAGLEARDEILAIADRRVSEGRLDSALTGLAPRARVPVLVTRDGWVQRVELELDAASPSDTRIVRRPAPSAEQAQTLLRWLSPAEPTPTSGAE